MKQKKSEPTEEILELKDHLVDKYRPKTIDEMVLEEPIKQYFKNMVQAKSIPNMTLIGSPGFGKTTLALCLANEVNATVHFVKCAINGGVDYIASSLKPFCDSMSLDGRPKVVILDELDSASSTQQSSFQKALRSLIESATDTTFICTANFNNIISPVLSRCPPIKIAFTPKDLLIRIKTILDSEKVEYEQEDLKAFLKHVVKKLYPDIRATLNYLQASITTGKLVVTKDAVVETERNEFLKSLVDCIVANYSKPLEIRKFYLANKESISDYQAFTSELFNYVLDNNIVVDFKTTMKLGDVSYQMSQAIDKEIQFYNFIATIADSIAANQETQETH